MVWLLDRFMRLTKDMEHMEQVQRERANVGAEDARSPESFRSMEEPEDGERWKEAGLEALRECQPESLG
jgi:hypothetical protein